MQKAVFHYGESRLSIGLALEICRRKRKGLLSAAAKERILRSQQLVERIIEKDEIVYGVNTGFGPLCNVRISGKDTRKLQHNLLISHSVGVGEFIDSDLAKLMLILKVHALAHGYSGITLRTIERMLWFIENDIIPCVPEQGSVGASGDLAPLAHLFLPLIGWGHVFYHGNKKAAIEVLREYDMKPLQLEAKEGLALINGTQFMSALGVRAAEKLQNCLDHADIIAAMNLEAMLGSAKPFNAGLHQLRPYDGCLYVAHRMRKLLKGSEILDSHAHCGQVQDPYSLRCIPQVHGASRNAWRHLKESLHIEINSVTDNPILFDEETVVSGGNFHGQPIALPLDYATLAAAELGNIADRRIYLSLEGKAEGVPMLLMQDTGLNSGFMIPQYTSAALVSENKSLCFPASADSIPTSLGQEDHVSMGSISARRVLQVTTNLEKILGIELLCAAQGFDFRKPLKSTRFLNLCHNYIRSRIQFAEVDRYFYEDMKLAIQMIRDKELIQIINKEAGDEFTNEKHEVFGIY